MCLFICSIWEEEEKEKEEEKEGEGGREDEHCMNYHNPHDYND